MNTTNYTGPKEVQRHLHGEGLPFQAALCFNTLFFKSSKKKETQYYLLFHSCPNIWYGCLESKFGGESRKGSGPHRKSEGMQPDPVPATLRKGQLRVRLPNLPGTEHPAGGSLPTDTSPVGAHAETHLKNACFLLSVHHSSRLGPLHLVSVNPASKFMV